MLDADDIGAKIGEELRRVDARLGREVEDAEVAEG
jgi:hypothetical protein